MAPLCTERAQCASAQIKIFPPKLISFGVYYREDCGGIHIFTSEVKRSYEDKSLADIDKYFSPDDHTGIMKNYLLDPEHAFTDEITDNLTQILYSKNKTQLASDRMSNDIVVLNFYFDTHIISR